MRHALFHAVCAAAALLCACTSGKATEAECKTLRAHFVEVMSRDGSSAEAAKTKKLAEDMAPKVYEDCLREVTSSQIACALKETTMAGLQRCSDEE